MVFTAMRDWLAEYFLGHNTAGGGAGPGTRKHVRSCRRAGDSGSSSHKRRNSAKSLRICTVAFPWPETGRQRKLLYATGAGQQARRLTSCTICFVHPADLFPRRDSDPEIIPVMRPATILVLCLFWRWRGAQQHEKSIRLLTSQEAGRAATYVETMTRQRCRVEELSLRFSKTSTYYGLVEVEFAKRDHRDGKFKLLDVNARTWGFHSIGGPAGVDFPRLSYADQDWRTCWLVFTGVGVGCTAAHH